MKEYKLIAKTFSGLEDVLAKEVKRIGGKNVRRGKRAVFYEGDLELIYKSNYNLRAALRILKEIEHFNFKNVDQFYLKCKRIKWQNYFNVDQNFVINSVVVNSRDFRNSMFASLKVKDAIADYFRENYGKRPNVDTDNPDIIINVHIFQDTCTLSIDSSGESLHKRGYRVKQGDAPLNEVLAAGMIYLTGWMGNSDFMDPMCGSGTLPIEAAMIAQNIPAAKFRKEFAFQLWNDFDPLLWEKVTEPVEKRDFRYKIYASDISGSNLLNAQTNARRALVFNKIEFKCTDFKDLEIDLNNATILTNPPYGERLRENDLDGLYSMIGERFKHQYAGNSAWILSSAFDSLKFVGLKPSQKVDLFNGALKCKFNNYRLFEGKEK
ncbi:class I SAM-dependent RNA methyltransferase [Draconibacterium sp. IB214405]|uniref:THUMP domain-containing class I SAM-dependent RNA methyltransferase n=1 Tax=Draconibacterium sp. IB214405 TaxID=3097352 RepID=UPI002A17C180|nr:class I SAM-dependent RNA methyltransferase [Draconibacterium sp. IB214405]MDX8339899.1 class I SAM-dependent RNA methyltransferase [Draconibacterium sp. IB214405]